MNTLPKSDKVVRCLLAVVLMAAVTMTTMAQDGQIGARPLTHQEIHDLGLPEDTQVSGGLFTVGVGQPVYLEAQVDIGIPASDILDVTWALVSQPVGSTTNLVDSPLGTNVPIYSVGDREVYQVADRKLLVPDATGLYAVMATVNTTGGSIVLTRSNITASTYMGYFSCILCHDGGVLEDKRSWAETDHATFFTLAIDGLKSSHYNEGCIQCHTVGYDTAPAAVNDGFDDTAARLGWTFPTNLMSTNWDAMPQELQLLSNIQCENCHGAGREHAEMFGAPGSTDRITVSFSSGDCAQCHDEKPYHTKNIEWNNSRHAVATRYPTGENRESCVICHSGIGFVDYVDEMSPPRVDYEAITCAACHDPHSAKNPHQIRTTADVALNDNITTITDGGLGKLCMNCHKSRRDAVDYVQSYHSHYGPHHGPQADMIAGANAIDYGNPIPSSGHLVAVEDACVTCHLQEPTLGDGEAGGHTFKMKWDAGTPGDPSDDVDLVGACQQCHGPVTTFDFARADYNGDGVLEGVQTEVEHLMHGLAMMLPPIGQPTVEVAPSYTGPQLEAAYNYLMVEEDGSKGIHNTSFAVGLLNASIADLTDDADKDGLLDTWEIQHFGSITAYDGTGDPDKDGANNALELAAGTNPMLLDSDGDNFFDYAELMAGSDPLNPQDVPGFIVKIYTAAEVEFASELGKTYQIQAVSEVSGTWQNVGDPIDGTGDMISYLTTTRTESEEYFRVVEVSP